MCGAHVRRCKDEYHSSDDDAHVTLRIALIASETQTCERCLAVQKAARDPRGPFVCPKCGSQKIRHHTFGGPNRDRFPAYSCQTFGYGWGEDPVDAVAPSRRKPWNPTPCECP